MLTVLIRHRIKKVPSLGTFKHPDNDKCVLLPVRGALSCLSNLRSHDFPIDPFCTSFRSMRDILDHVPFFLLPLPNWKDFSSLKQNLTAQVMGLWEQQWSGIKGLRTPRCLNLSQEFRRLCSSPRLSQCLYGPLQVPCCSKHLLFNNSAQLLHLTI